MRVYLLQHGHELDEGTTDVKTIGVYASEADARAAQTRLSESPGFRDHRDGFSIDAYELGRDHWTQGFTSIRPADAAARAGTAAA